MSVAAASAASQASPLAPYVTRVPDRDQKRACGHHAEDPADTGRQRRNMVRSSTDEKGDLLVSWRPPSTQLRALRYIDPVNPSPVISSTKPCAPAHGGAHVTRCVSLSRRAVRPYATRATARAVSLYRSPNRIPLKRAAEPLATDADAAAAESGMDAAGAVGLAALDVDLPTRSQSQASASTRSEGPTWAASARSRLAEAQARPLPSRCLCGRMAVAGRELRRSSGDTLGVASWTRLRS